MSLIYIHWQTDHIYYKRVQKDKPGDHTENKQYHPKTTNDDTNTHDKYTRSEAYKLTCPDCHKAYVGQTGRSFLERFNEHKSAFKINSHTSNYANTS